MDAAASAPEAAPEAVPSEPKAAGSMLKVDGQRFDLSALLNFQVLQDLLRSFSQQSEVQLEMIRGLQRDLEAEKRSGEEMVKRLKAEIDLKATEKALSALALETSRDKAAMQKKIEQLEASTQKKFDKHEQKMESQQSKLYDVKVELDTKAAQRTVDALTTRVDGCATAVELADAKILLKSKIEEARARRRPAEPLFPARARRHGRCRRAHWGRRRSRCRWPALALPPLACARADRAACIGHSAARSPTELIGCVSGRVWMGGPRRWRAQTRRGTRRPRR